MRESPIHDRKVSYESYSIYVLWLTMMLLSVTTPIRRGALRGVQDVSDAISVEQFRLPRHS